MFVEELDIEAALVDAKSQLLRTRNRASPGSFPHRVGGLDRPNQARPLLE